MNVDLSRLPETRLPFEDVELLLDNGNGMGFEDNGNFMVIVTVDGKPMKKRVSRKHLTGKSTVFNIRG